MRSLVDRLADLVAKPYTPTAPPKFSPAISWAELADAWLGTINERMAELDAATPTKEQTMITVKFTVSSLSNLFALNVSTGADSWTYESSNVSPSRTLVTVYFVNPDNARAYLEKLDLDVLVGRVLVSTPKECKMVEGYCLSGETVSLNEGYLRKSREPRKVDWTKPLRHLGGLQVRYVETLVARVRFKHLCVIGTENQYAALFDDQGQPEVWRFAVTNAVTNAPEVKTLRVGVTRVGLSVGLTGPQNLALTWEGDKLIKAEVL